MATHTPAENASLALSHLFMGIMKIDGAITLEEERKLEILLHKLGHDLPGDQAQILENLDVILEDPDMKNWTPQQHLDGCFVFFDEFVASGQATAKHIDSVIDMADLLTEVDGVSPGEIVYLEKIVEGFNFRYRTKNN